MMKRSENKLNELHSSTSLLKKRISAKKETDSGISRIGPPKKLSQIDDDYLSNREIKRSKLI